ncbi:MAG: tRNA (adenosine(37)-N6)-threonylcarbamoyltransferase complex ATPase subunit type 1 TsaE [Candidatus Melainabacteria bacterium]|nr:tRNA (adenosine(37)-N6)-threonylcarbamoyltransferase complex ATPase subunit type 1 TsaE [Candidatus Melainabacteria bacterium]
MKRIEKVSNNPEETFQMGKELALKINSPVLIGLSGELGSGKTVFAKGFASGLEVKELITSPTFLGISESFSGRLPFIHMDFYKKVVTKDMIQFYMDKKSVVLIEWFENFVDVFKEELDLDMRMYIQYLKDTGGNIIDNMRQIQIEFPANGKAFNQQIF